ncbi:MAG: hypothetical protein ACRCYO_00165 [Bacteroidia bacterium]
MLVSLCILAPLLLFFVKPSPWYLLRQHEATTNTTETESTRNPTAKFAMGDFDGDGKIDSVWCQTPRSGTDSGHTFIRFNHHLQRIRVAGCSMGLSYLGTATNYTPDKADCIYFIPAWQNSCMSNGFLYAYENNRWQLLDSVALYRCSEQQSAFIDFDKYEITYKSSEHGVSQTKMGYFKSAARP